MNNGSTWELFPSIRVFKDVFERHCDAASVFDLLTGTYQAITICDPIPIPETGDIDELYKLFAPFVTPECREEYLSTMNTNFLRENLAEATTRSYLTFLNDESGSTHCKRNDFYVLDHDGRFVLAVLKDATDDHRRNQILAKARDNATNFSSSANMAIDDLIVYGHKRRTVLVAESIKANREVLKGFLSDEYNVIEAENADEALDILHDSDASIDIVLLNLHMPKCNGFELLQDVRSNPNYANVPVIVTTDESHRADEARCLKLGATDFVTRPYDIEGLLGRIRSAIRMNEVSAMIAAFKIDKTTGLYTLPAFYLYAQQKLLQKDARYNLAVIVIRDFAILNSIHGSHKCDEVLSYVAAEIKEKLPGSIVARKGRRFYALMPLTQPLRSDKLYAHAEKIREGSPVPNVRLQIGICLGVDGSIPIATHCDRAKLAVQSIESDEVRQIAYFNDDIEERAARSLETLASFDKALEEDRFEAWLQPKINSFTGEIDAAEALVRWASEDGSFVSPGEFIPLLEQEGRIKELDERVFNIVCKYQQNRLAAGKKVVPISTNLSRNSLFSSGIVRCYTTIADSFSVPRNLLPIEITESSARSNKLIADICYEFNDAGFSLHMDDFGTGYSSLSSLAYLPFDVLKLDKSLIDQFGTRRGRAVIKNAIETAQDLGMSVVAEGVENQEQIDYLASLDCSIIQGYYYAAPMRMADFDELLKRERPFGDRSARDESLNKYPALCMVDFKRYLKLARSLHSTIVVHDFKGGKTFSVKASGGAAPYEGNCFDTLGLSQQCDNCIARRAFRAKDVEVKIDRIGKTIFAVRAQYVEVDGKPRVVEMIDKIASQP